MGGTRNAYIVLVKEYEGKTLLGKPKQVLMGE
jgi:hypothetical protein